MKSKIVFILLTCLFCFNLQASHHHHHDHGYQFTVHKKDYSFSTVFELEDEDCLVGSILKSVFRIRTNYDIYDPYGKYMGTGICRFFSLGLFYTWATNIDIYDANGNWIGLIDGCMFTTEAAKFDFYNYKGDCVGLAYLDNSKSGFSIEDPNNSAHIIGCLNLHGHEADHWEVSIFDKNPIQRELIEVFATFICDKRKAFMDKAQGYQVPNGPGQGYQDNSGSGQGYQDNSGAGQGYQGN